MAIGRWSTVPRPGTGKLPLRNRCCQVASSGEERAQRGRRGLAGRPPPLVDTCPFRATDCTTPSVSEARSSCTVRKAVCARTDAYYAGWFCRSDGPDSRNELLFRSQVE